MIVVHHEDTLLQDLGGGNTRRILAWNDDLMLVEVGFDSGTVGGSSFTCSHSKQPCLVWTL